MCSPVDFRPHSRIVAVARDRMLCARSRTARRSRNSALPRGSTRRRSGPTRTADSIANREAASARTERWRSRERRGGERENREVATAGTERRRAREQRRPRRRRASARDEPFRTPLGRSTGDAPRPADGGSEATRRRRGLGRRRRPSRRLSVRGASGVGAPSRSPATRGRRPLGSRRVRSDARRGTRTAGRTPRGRA